MADAAKKDVSADASEPVRQTGEGKRGDYTPSSGQKKTGKAKRREKRLRNEPKSISGEQTPVAVNVLDFAEARATELHAMTRALEGKPAEGGRRVFQQLPRHMRRRAMSHNPRRLPRRLQEKAAREMEKQSANQKKKTKSRKQRRKPRNLRDNSERRCRGHALWLETHLWHSKRMHMRDHYGYCVAERTNDKGVRQAYRSLRYGCLLSDMSYQCTIELSGQRDDIINYLTPFFNTETGLTVASCAHSNGARAGHCVMYQADRYPYGAIGPVEFLWQPNTLGTGSGSTCMETSQSSSGNMCSKSEQDSVTSTKLWLVVSPAIHDEVMTELSVAMETFCHRDDKSSAKVNVKSLKDEFVRFRLIGPRSHALVMETLKPVTDKVDTQDKVNNLTCSIPDLTRIPVPVPWWNEDTSFHDHTRLLNSHIGMLHSASSPDQFPNGTVLGMIVEDPRLRTPSKKTDMVSSFYPKKRMDWWVEAKRGEGEGGEEGEFGDISDTVEDVARDVSGGDDMSERGEIGEERENGDNVSMNGAICDERGDVKSVSDRAAESHIETECMTTTTITTTATSSSNGQMERLRVASSADFPPGLAYTPLWSPGVRDIVKGSHIPHHILNNVRAKCLAKIPVLDLGAKSPRIPVMLIRQSFSAAHVDSVLQLEGSHCHGYQTGMSQSITTVSASGWDLVLPSNWAMAFWVSLVYRGGRACGTMGLRKCHLECGVPCFPDDYPDARAGRELAVKTRREAEEKFCRYPPDKRRNYGKLSIQNPFHSPWNELVRDWQSWSLINKHEGEGEMEGEGEGDREREVGGERKVGEGEGEVGQVVGEEEAQPPAAKRPRIASNIEERLNCDTRGDIYVLRSKSALFQLSHFFHRLRSSSCLSHSSTASNQVHHKSSPTFQKLMKEHKIDTLLSVHSNTLVAITFEMLHRGNANNNDIISAPMLSDLKNLFADPQTYHGPDEKICPKGVTVVDGNTICVGVSGLTWKGLEEVKAARKKKATAKKKSVEKNEGIERPKEEVLQASTEDFKLRPLSQSRFVIGYTTTSGMRLRSSRNGGIGFCSLAGLLEVARQNYDFKCACENGEIGEEGRREGGSGELGDDVRGGRWGREDDLDLLVLIRGESVHHRFARFNLLHNP